MDDVKNPAVAVSSLRLAGAALFPLFMITYSIGVANGYRKFVAPALVSASNLIVTTIGNAYLATHGGDVRALMLWNALVSYLAAGVLFAYVNRLTQTGIRPRWEWTLARSLMVFASFAWMGRLGGLLATSVDRLIISASLGVAMVPSYVIPMSLARYLLTAASALGTVVFPLTSLLHSRQEMTELRSMYIRSARLFATLGAGVPLIISVGSATILHVWLGNDVGAASSAVLSMGALLTGVTFLTTIPSFVAEGMGHPRLTGTARIAHNLTAIGLAIWLTPVWGIKGTAFSFLLPGLVIAPVFGRLVEKRLLRLSFAEVFRAVYFRALLLAMLVVIGTKTIVEILTPSDLMSLLLFLLSSTAWYLVSAVLVRALPPDDIRVVLGARHYLLKPTKADSD
jgi:O-antigen/teichoic acid export membrane protein